jgi:nucleotide-binding universal stress UspA family protein
LELASLGKLFSINKEDDMYKRILVAVDGSDTSTKALVAALQMARESGGVLRIIHVLEDLAQVMAYDYYGAYPGDLAKVLQDNGQKVLADALAIAKSSGVETEDRLLEARGMRLGEAVVQEATQFNADLVVVGTHGRRGLGRVLLGSGAEQVIRLSPIPVLVIRSPEQAPAPAQAGPAGMPSHA